MADLPWDWIVTGAGLVGFWLSGSGVWWSWWVNVANQGLWAALALATGQHGFLVGAAFYLAVFGRNALRATAEHRDRGIERGSRAPVVLSGDGRGALLRTSATPALTGLALDRAVLDRAPRTPGERAWLGHEVLPRLLPGGEVALEAPDPDCPACSPKTAARRKKARDQKRGGYSPAPRCAVHAPPWPPTPPRGGARA